MWTTRYTLTFLARSSWWKFVPHRVRIGGLGEILRFQTQSNMRKRVVCNTDFELLYVYHAYTKPDVFAKRLRAHRMSQTCTKTRAYSWEFVYSWVKKCKFACPLYNDWVFLIFSANLCFTHSNISQENSVEFYLYTSKLNVSLRFTFKYVSTLGCHGYFTIYVGCSKPHNSPSNDPAYTMQLDIALSPVTSSHHVHLCAPVFH